MAGDGVVLIIFSSSLTGFQNLVVVCHSAWSYVGCARNLEGWNPAPWEVGLADPLERRPPCMRHVPNLVVSRSNSRSVRTTEIPQIRRKTDPKRPSLSASLNVFRSDTDRSATNDFLLVIHSRLMGLSLLYSWQ